MYFITRSCALSPARVSCGSQHLLRFSPSPFLRLLLRGILLPLRSEPSGDIQDSGAGLGKIDLLELCL